MGYVINLIWVAFERVVDWDQIKKHMNKYETLYTDFLFTTPNYLTGAANIFNLAGNFYDFNSSESDDEADKMALKNDFKIVGRDLANTIGKVKKK